MGRSAESVSALSPYSNGGETKVSTSAPACAHPAARTKTSAKSAHWTWSSVFPWTSETKDAGKMEWTY